MLLGPVCSSFGSIEENELRECSEGSAMYPEREPNGDGLLSAFDRYVTVIEALLVEDILASGVLVDTP